MATATATCGDLAAAVEARLRRGDLLAGVDHLLVGCSGGGDSVALTALLRQLRPRLRVSLLHCDHQARSESGGDVDFVRALADSWGLPCHVERTALPEGFAGSREAGWRDLRLRAYHAAAARSNADAVALGHTADDQAETVLLNVARGTGLRGLAAMRERSVHEGLTILRPLLSIRRESLREYARDRGLRWRDDPSNEDLSFSRNRLRARVLPQLETVAPGAVANIGRMSELLAQHEAYLLETARAARTQLQLPEDHPGGLALSADGLAALPRPVAAALLREFLCALRGDLRGITREHVDAVLDGVVVGEPPAIDLPGVRVRREADRLRLLPLRGRQLAGAVC